LPWLQDPNEINGDNVNNILWCAAWKQKYLNLSGRPLLDNSSVTRFPVSLSGWQLNTFTRQRIHRQTFPAQRRCRFRYYR
jgi:hypothetical protein